MSVDNKGAVTGPFLIDSITVALSARIARHLSALRCRR
jgi:hypothetical protein